MTFKCNCHPNSCNKNHDLPIDMPFTINQPPKIGNFLAVKASINNCNKVFVEVLNNINANSFLGCVAAQCETDDYKELVVCKKLGNKYYIKEKYKKT